MSLFYPQKMFILGRRNIEFLCLGWCNYQENYGCLWGPDQSCKYIGPRKKEKVKSAVGMYICTEFVNRKGWDFTLNNYDYIRSIHISVGFSACPKIWNIEHCWIIFAPWKVFDSEQYHTLLLCVVFMGK